MITTEMEQKTKDESSNLMISIRNQSSELLSKLEEWTGLKVQEIVVDTKQSHNFSFKLLTEIIGRKQIAFILYPNTSIKNAKPFGYYLSTEVQGIFSKRMPTDENTFHFCCYHLDSQKKAHYEPKKYPIKDVKRGGISLQPISSQYLISLGDILISRNYRNTHSIYDIFQTR